MSQKVRTAMIRQSRSEAASPSYRKSLERLVEMVGKLNPKEGCLPTAIPFLFIARRTHPTQFTTAVLNPSLCLVLQGRKQVHLGPDVIRYNAGDFLASLIDMPASGNVLDATPSSPYYGLRVDFATKEIASVISEAKISVKPRDKKLRAAAFVGKSDEEILGLFIRLLQLLEKPAQAAFVAALIKREMIFRLLTGAHGHLLFQQTLFDHKTEGIGKIMGWIRENYSNPLSIEQLAKSNNMSVSGLHHKFKAITTMGPLQYQKQFRL